MEQKGKYRLTTWVEQNPLDLPSYLGNFQVKKHGVDQPWTPDLFNEYKKCKKDVNYFIEKYVKVVHLDHGRVDFVPYPYQKNMLNNYVHNRFNITLACRQSGKSISSLAYLLWEGVFGSDKTILILANKGSTSKEMLGRITLMLENLPFFLQPGCKALNKGSIEFSNGSRIEAHATGSDSVRGKSGNIIYLDEFAFIQNDEEFYTSTYPVISSGKSTKVIVTSTANGIANRFYKMWEAAVQGVSSYKPFRVDWWDVPGRDEAWKQETIANTSPEQFDQEFGNNFGGSSTTLIDASVLLTLKAKSPIKENQKAAMYDRPRKDHKYVMTVDVAKGRGQDYSTFTVFDVTEVPFKQVAVFRDNLISPLVFPSIIVRFAKMYNNAYVVVEANDHGGLVYKTLYYDFEYEYMYSGAVKHGRSLGLEMTKKTKATGCSNLKDLVEQRKLTICDLTTIEELSYFEAKGDSYAARDGNHDDMVMTLVSFAWFVDTDIFGGIADSKLQDMMNEERRRMISESVPLFGHIPGKTENVVEIWDVKDENMKAAWKVDEVFGKEFGLIEVAVDEDPSKDFLL